VGRNSDANRQTASYHCRRATDVCADTGLVSFQTKQRGRPHFCLFPTRGLKPGRQPLPKPQERNAFPSAPSNGAGFQAILAMNMGEPAMALVALAAVDSGPMRLILFILVLVAVILIIVGCIIALLTWRKRQQVYSTYMNAMQLERDKV